MRRGAEEKAKAPAADESLALEKYRARKRKSYGEFSMINSNFVLAGYHDRIFMNILGRQENMHACQIITFLIFKHAERGRGD
jgi:hypothetical protein